MRSKKLVNRYVGERLRRMRVARGLKVQEIARRAGLPPSSYSCLEGGWYNINLDNLFRILQVLEANVTSVWPGGHLLPGGVVGDDAVADLLTQARANQPYEMTVDDVLQAVAGIYDIDLDDLASGSRRRILSEARAVAAALVKEVPQLTLTELSQSLGVHISSLSHCTKRLQAKADADSGILQRVDQVRQKLWHDFKSKQEQEESEATESGGSSGSPGNENKRFSLTAL